MSLFLTDEQVVLRDAAQKFSQKEVEPIATQIDIDEYAPPELTQKVAEQGLFGLFIPTQYGGMGCELTTTTLVIEEIAKASPSFAGLLAVQIVLCPETIRMLGTEEQKTRFLPKIASGEKLFAYSNTEPAGGMNWSRHTTKITKDDINYRLDGAKLFCTQGEASMYMVMGRTRVGDKEGHGCAVVERGTPGFNIAPYENKLGWRGTNTGPLSFNDVLITPDNILGDLLTAGTGTGSHSAANEACNIAHSATSLGAVEGLFGKTLAYVKERNLYGEPMYKLQPISYWLAQVYSKKFAMRSMLYNAARLWDEKSTAFPMFTGATKLYVCELAFECTNTLLQMWGGNGMMHSTGINRYMRDARLNMVAEGSSEGYASMIAEFALGLS